MTQERSSWAVKETAVIGELIKLMDLSAEEQALLGSLHEQARAVTPQLTATFYERLFAHPHTAEYLEGRSMDRLRNMVSDWFVDMFSGTYDEAFAQKRIGIGAIHVQIGLPVRYPLAMLDVIMPFGEHVAQQSPQPEQAVVAFRKLLALDVAIFNQAYEDNQLKHLAELVGGERLARNLLSGAGG
jgi:hypothetical protein